MTTSPLIKPERRERMIKVWIDGSVGSYRTVQISEKTTSREVISRLVSRVKVRCADPQLHQLHMQVTVQGTIKTVKLEDGTRLCDIISCNPWGNYKFILVTKQSVTIRVWDNISEDVVFRSLAVSTDSDVDTVLAMLHNFYPDVDKNMLALYETSELLGFSRKLNEGEILFKIMESWEDESQFKLVLKSKPNVERKSAFTNMHHFLKSMIGVIDDDTNDESSDCLAVDNILDASVVSFNNSYSELSDVSSVNSDSFLFVPFSI